MNSDIFYFLAVIINISLGERWWRFGQYEYIRSNNKETFDGARKWCKNRGGLVTIFSSEENEFIKTSVCRGTNECWMALTTDDKDCTACDSGRNPSGCRSCRAKWYWIDGSDVTYKNWASREPTGGSTCARMKGEYSKWWDSPSCNDNHYAICKREYDACSSNPCHHDGSCRNTEGYFTCDCVYGYTGLLCETDIDFCSNGHCKNNATCIDQLLDFRCECRNGFSGNYCETDIDECMETRCIHGTCNNIPGSFECHCKYGYTGSLCETDIDWCDIIYCQNNGTCSEQGEGYMCMCNGGFKGRHCELQMTESSNDSKNYKEEGLLTALYVGLTGFLLSFLILVYFTLTDHTVKKKLQKLITSMRADLTNGNDMRNVPTTSREMNLDAS